MDKKSRLLLASLGLVALGSLSTLFYHTVILGDFRIVEEYEDEEGLEAEDEVLEEEPTADETEADSIDENSPEGEASSTEVTVEPV